MVIYSVYIFLNREYKSQDILQVLDATHNSVLYDCWLKDSGKYQKISGEVTDVSNFQLWMEKDFISRIDVEKDFTIL